MPEEFSFSRPAAVTTGVPQSVSAETTGITAAADAADDELFVQVRAVISLRDEFPFLQGEVQVLAGSEGAYAARRRPQKSGTNPLPEGGPPLLGTVAGLAAPPRSGRSHDGGRPLQAAAAASARRACQRKRATTSGGGGSRTRTAEGRTAAQEGVMPRHQNFHHGLFPSGSPPHAATEAAILGREAWTIWLTLLPLVRLFGPIVSSMAKSMAKACWLFGRSHEKP